MTENTHVRWLLPLLSSPVTVKEIHRCRGAAEVFVINLLSWKWGKTEKPISEVSRGTVSVFTV